MKKVPILDSLVGVYAAVEGEFSTQSSAYVHNLTTSFTPKYTGKYTIFWYLQMCSSKINGSYKYRVIDNLQETFVEEIYKFSVNYANNGWHSFSGFKEVTLVHDIIHTLYVDFASLTDSAYIKNCRVKILKTF